MDHAEQFASEWQSLQEQRQQLIAEGDRLKRTLNNLPDEPSIALLLEEMSQLKEKVKELEGKSDLHQGEIRHMQNILQRRRQAITDKHLQQELGIRLTNRRERLAELERVGAPKVIQENERRLIWEVEAPIAELEQRFREQIAEEERKRRVVAQVLQETLDRIAAIEGHYRQTKRQLREAIQETERRRQQLYEDSVQWAVQDRHHLQWTLEREASCRDDVIRRYRTKFPTDTLSDLLPSPTTQLVQARSFPKARRKRKDVALPATPPATALTAKTWRFFITFNEEDQGDELSGEEALFLSDLQEVLRKAAYHSLNVQIVYNKLLAVTRMTVQQRQEMDKVVEAQPAGWKILRLGRKHRVFLSIDEDTCQVRFMPRLRKKSYSQH